MADKKKQLSDKDLKRVTGGAMSAGTSGGQKHGGKRHKQAGQSPWGTPPEQKRPPIRSV